ncbi:DUF1000-domain-containing protein [Meredithblackwellia eburnea MCA 4105]
MSIKVINSVAELNNATSNGSSVSVIDFHAVWCGPCKVIAPVFSKLASQYAGRVQFLKVDVDKAQDVAQKFSISAMPTFVVLRGSNKIDEMKGADPAGLESMIRRHAPTASASSSGGSVEKGLEGVSVLNSFINNSQVTCLNEDASHTIKDLMKGSGDKWLLSDADEQLLLTIPLQQTTKIRALRFKTVDSAAASAPKTIKLFVNRPNLGFDDAEGEEGAQEIVLTEAQTKGTESVQLRFVRFQSVSALSIFVSDNQGGEDVTRIDKLELLGVTVDGTDMSQLSKGEHDHDH